MNRSSRIGCGGLALLVIILLTVFLTRLTFDGINANMLHLEGEPKEGWQYWRDKELDDALPQLLALWTLSASSGAFLLWWMLKRRAK